MKNKEWTIMVYMAGDNNLAVDMAYALEQIKRAAGGTENNPNVFVYYDGNSPSIPTLYCDFSQRDKPKYVRSFMVNDKLFQVPPTQNENAADEKSVLNFVNWCVNQVEVVNENGKVTKGRRANKYGLIFSGHSLGFQDIGLFRDETAGKAMKMIDLYYLLRRLAATEQDLENDIEAHGLRGENRESATRVVLGQKIDILGFDSCVMGMLEVGYQFHDLANVLIASEGSVPNAGWTYAELLGKLACGKPDNGNTLAVGEEFVREFITTQDSYTVGGVSVDMAAWDLNCLGDLASAFDRLAAVLIKCFADPESRIYRQMQRSVLQAHWKCQSYMHDQNVDLGDFCELLDRECSLIAEDLRGGDDLELLEHVKGACRTVLDELNKAVILSGFSGGNYQYSNGIAVFFPWSRECYEASRENYQSLWFSKESPTRKFVWNAFLEKYLNEVALRRSEPLTPDAQPGSKYRYESGIEYDESPVAFAVTTNGATRIPGQDGSKIPNQDGSKIPNQDGSKMSGQEGSKLAAVGGANAFFDSLRLFKNIEGRWNISGFTKRPAKQNAVSKAQNG